MRRILVLRGGALGDFLVTLPALALLRSRWPGARIELAGNATAAALAQRRGLLDAAHGQQERRWGALYAPAPLPADLAAWLAEFDLVLNFWPDPEHDLRRRFPLRPDQRLLSASATPESAPAAAHFCAPLAALGLAPAGLVYPLLPHTTPSPGSPAAIVVHPGSGSPRKNWPADRWRELLARLPGPLEVVLGEAEAGTWPAARDLPPHARAIVQPPLEELAERLARCRLFLGHDSGISHLAAACGAPSVLLFGPTDPAMWAPPAPAVQVIRRGSDLAQISVRDVLEAIQSKLEDRPGTATA